MRLAALHSCVNRQRLRASFTSWLHPVRKRVRKSETPRCRVLFAGNLQHVLAGGPRAIGRPPDHCPLQRQDCLGVNTAGSLFAEAEG